MPRQILSFAEQLVVRGEGMGAQAGASVEGIKALGNDAFARSDFEGAAGHYTDAIALLASGDGNAEASSGVLEDALLSNRAQSFLHLGRLQECVADCTKVLDRNDAHTKARHRRAVALRRMGRLREAHSDAAKLSSRYPDSKEFAAHVKGIRDALARGPTPDVDDSSTVEGAIASLERFAVASEDERRAAMRGVRRGAARWSETESERFCCSGGLPGLQSAATSSTTAACDGASTNDTYAVDAYLAIAALATGRRAAARACAAFLRETTPALEAHGVRGPADASAFAKMHLAVAGGAGEGEGNAIAIDTCVGALVRLMAHRRGEAKGQGEGAGMRAACLDAIFDSGLCPEAFWSALLAREDASRRLLTALLEGGYGRRHHTLCFIGLAKRTLGLEGFKARIAATLGTPGAGASHAPLLAGLSDESQLVLVDALLVSLAEAGDWLLTTTAIFESVMEVAARALTPAVASVGADAPVRRLLSSILSHLATCKEGHAKFSEARVQALLGALAEEHGDRSTRAATMLTLAKIARKEGGAEEEEGLALECVMMLAAAGSGIGPGGAEGARDAEVATTVVEALVFLASSGSGVVKDVVSAHLGECSVPALAQARAPPHVALSYGLAKLFCEIVSTREEAEQVTLLCEEADEETKVREAAMKALGGDGAANERGGVDTATDTKERCEARKRDFCQAEGVAALAALIPRSSRSTADLVAEALFHCAAEPFVRAAMAQQGALGALLRLARAGEQSTTAKCKIMACHGLARILISVDPRLLSEQCVFECVSPLVHLCGQDYALQQFEALLSLTNLATVGWQVQERIVSSGFGAIEELQWSNHGMVVRAATELLCNCVSCPRVLASISDENKQKVWLALAFSEDLPTSLAASGAIAMAAGDENVAKSLMPHAERFECLAQHENPGVQQRARVILEHL